jgi:hypothetical protein
MTYIVIKYVTKELGLIIIEEKILRKSWGLLGKRLLHTSILTSSEV